MGFYVFVFAVGGACLKNGFFPCDFGNPNLSGIQTSFAMVQSGSVYSLVRGLTYGRNDENPSRFE